MGRMVHPTATDKVNIASTQNTFVQFPPVPCVPVSGAVVFPLYLAQQLVNAGALALSRGGLARPLEELLLLSHTTSGTVREAIGNLMRGNEARSTGNLQKIE